MEERKPLNIEIQEINRSRIYKLLLDGENFAKKDIVQQLRLCLPTVTKNIERLIKDGLIRKAGSKGYTGGRRAVTYAIAGDARIAFGVDITRNHVTIVAVNLYGKIMSSVRHRIAFEPSNAYYKKIADEIKTEYPDVEFNSLYVDNASMQLVKNPNQFDVIVTSNMFGDIISDEASQITGSIGMLASASIGDGSGPGLYEPIHGSAPDIAGLDIANPLATILSAAMLLRYDFGL